MRSKKYLLLFVFSAILAAVVLLFAKATGVVGPWWSVAMFYLVSIGAGALTKLFWEEINADG